MCFSTRAGHSRRIHRVRGSDEPLHATRNPTAERPGPKLSAKREGARRCAKVREGSAAFFYKNSLDKETIMSEYNFSSSEYCQIFISV